MAQRQQARRTDGATEPLLHSSPSDLFFAGSMNVSKADLHVGVMRPIDAVGAQLAREHSVIVVGTSADDREQLLSPFQFLRKRADGMGFAWNGRMLAPIILMICAVLLNSVYRALSYKQFLSCAQDGGVLLDCPNSSSTTECRELDNSAPFSSVSGQLYCSSDPSGSAPKLIGSHLNFVAWIDLMPLYAPGAWVFFACVTVLHARWRLRSSEGPKHVCPHNHYGDGSHRDPTDETLFNEELHSILEAVQGQCPCFQCHQVLFGPLDVPPHDTPGEPKGKAAGRTLFPSLFDVFFPRPHHQTIFYRVVSNGLQLRRFVFCAIALGIIVLLGPFTLTYCRESLSVAQVANMTCPSAAIQSGSMYIRESTSCDWCSRIVLLSNIFSIVVFSIVVIVFAVALGVRPSSTAVEAFSQQLVLLQRTSPNSLRLIAKAIHATSELYAQKRTLDSSQSASVPPTRTSWRSIRLPFWTATCTIGAYILLGSGTYVVMSYILGDDPQDCLDGLMRLGGWGWTCIALGMAVVFTTINMLFRLILEELHESVKHCATQMAYLTSFINPHIQFKQQALTTVDAVVRRLEQDKFYILDWLDARRFFYTNIINYELSGANGIFKALTLVSVATAVTIVATLLARGWQVLHLLVPITLLSTYACCVSTAMFMRYFYFLIKFLDLDQEQLMHLNEFVYFIHSRTFVYSFSVDLHAKVAKEIKSFQQLVAIVGDRLLESEPGVEFLSIPLRRTHITLIRTYALSLAATMGTVVLNSIFGM